ncbi:MAG TPA: SHOCT domain-containing protein [Planctomycetota bacterium]|nr:SHOCT domain-containing protein [Planctomycetota bacterium]
MEGCLIFGALLLGIAVFVAVAQAREKERARRAYQRSLEQLRRDPTNARLRTLTLELGRVYSNLMRDKKGHTTFDEVALMNDIGAACAAAAVVRAPERPMARLSVEERLRKLQSLVDQGMIDQDDFRRRKEAILDEV